MATIDLSRSATDFRKHYKSVRAQQGRVFVDDDYNENERIHGEDERRSRVDIIGPAGTPDNGFLITNPTVTGGHIDFDINPGTFYLGGLHLELEQLEKFQVQSDWLQFSGAAVPAPPTGGSRFDLVYLESWLQAVSAVEDSELFEVALAGPDTSTRMRVMRRVQVDTGALTGDCRQDWKTLTDSWTANNLGTLNNQNELTVNTKLTVEFEPGTNPNDLCSPPVAGGYLGAENQAIRVQLIDATHFTWGFDNAAPLYRVQVSNDGANLKRVITMLNEPKDQAHWPLAGQIVELLPWSAVLPNKEKLAERRGFLARVAASFDPDTKKFSLAASVPGTFGEGWKTRPDAAQLAPPEFFYLRVWNRGSDTVSPPGIPFIAGTPVTLGQTGLKVTITGNDRQPSDHWIIAARPESPNRVVPWLLEAGRGPHGYRRFYAPLAVIEWTVAGNLVTGKVIHDCRETFPPLTRLRNCCTYTVGDGVNSFGTFTKIQDAIDHLPAAGGEVCVLPGIYRENIHILNRHDISVHGCGRRTILQNGRRASNPVILIEDSQRIVIKSLAIECPAVLGVKLISSPAAEKQGVGLESIRLEDLNISARDFSAIHGRGGRYIRIERNDIRVDRLAQPLSPDSNAGKAAAVFVLADDVRIELNRIEANIDRRSTVALGGLQIGGGSERVEIRRNYIFGGNGNGITLGSFIYILEPNVILLLSDYLKAFEGSIEAFPGASLFIGTDDCPHPDPDPQDPKDPNGNPLVPVSDGDLVDIRIIDNEILKMGLNGIATVRFPLSGRGSPITVYTLDIDLNRIFSCVQIDLGDAPFSPKFPYGYGGVSLTACEYLTLRDNWIETNGRSYVDPICGVFVLAGAGLIIEQNQIIDNGPLTASQKLPTVGPRGGIVIAAARTPLVKMEANVSLTKLPGLHDGFPALRVSDNVVISPMGPALQVLARGQVSVQDNQLTSQGVESAGANAAATGILALLGRLGGATVRIFNLGISSEAVDFTGFKNMTTSQPLSPANAQPASVNASAALAGLIGGNVLFNDNQLLLALRTQDDTRIISSALIISADDVSMHGNQSDCRLLGQALSANALVVGWSARVADNRFKEHLDNRGVSAFTFGIMNSTTDNQGTRCFLILGIPALTVKTPNRSFVEIFNKDICQRAGTAFTNNLQGTLFDG